MNILNLDLRFPFGLADFGNSRSTPNATILSMLTHFLLTSATALALASLNNPDSDGMSESSA